MQLILDKRKRIYIESDRLQLILSNYDDKIGNSVGNGIGYIITAIAYAIPMIMSDFSKWKTFGLILQVILVLFGVAIFLYGVYVFYNAVEHPFNKDTLYDEIEEANLMKEHPHSIVLLKDTFNLNSNRFLVYYDSRWDCRLFLNYATITEDFAKDEQNIAKHLQMELKISEDKMEYAFEFEKVHEKYSPTSNENKCYRHRFYKFILNEFSDITKQDEFEIDGKKFYWMSIADMEADKKIMERNSDVVGFVKKAS